MSIRIKLLVVIYTRTCPAKSLSGNATYADATDVGKSRTVADQRESKQVSHWEGETLISAAQKQAIVTMLESKSGFDVLSKLPNKSADLVGGVIEAKLKILSSRVKTLTVDNGKEFAEHQDIDQTLDIQSYFADP